jgi:gliding motility associated protien GldN
MRSFLVILAGMFLAFAPGMLQAQAEETIITESSDPVEDKYLDDVVRRTMVFENRVLPYEPLREADIPWQKRIWRLIDVREKINLPFSYPLQPFFSILKEAVESGEIMVFKEDDFKEMLTPDEVQAKLNRIDTTTRFNLETYEDEVIVVHTQVNPDDIKKYRVKEIWYFDEEASRMGVRILGIAPIKDEYDPQTGVFRYSTPLFWVYYPEARETLSRYYVFNEFNDAAPGTWADLFEQRRFSSYIIKQSNVLDFRLQDYFDDMDEDKGIKILMESERIKAELFNWEHDLWSY